jgi:hypothetical protein
MTMNAENRIRLRPGNGGETGSASAAASVTEPRIPAHDRTATPLHPGIRSVRPRRRSHDTPYVVAKIQAMRTTMTVTATARPMATYSPSDRPVEPTTSGSCSPISTKTNELMRKTTISHTEVARTRDCEVSTRGPNRPSISPALTAARTPDTPRRSAGR